MTLSQPVSRSTDPDYCYTVVPEVMQARLSGFMRNFMRFSFMDQHIS
jgi:hypothetical protein